MSTPTLTHLPNVTPSRNQASCQRARAFGPCLGAQASLARRASLARAHAPSRRRGVGPLHRQACTLCHSRLVRK